MPAYIIVEIEILDPAAYEEYKKLAGATVEKYGGKYIVRGGKTEVLEGDWQPKRIRGARVRISTARQRVAELRRISRAAQDAPPHSQDKHDPGGRYVAWPVSRLSRRKMDPRMTGDRPCLHQIVTRGVAYSALLSDSRLGSSLFECALLRDNHPFISGQQPAEHPATVAITKSLPPDIMVKEPQAGAE
jgi:hypothetical protein